ncbi:MAG: rane protein [Solirubrobacteraceae bacterium]|jgi:membrane protein|nr:rane protein [Solirubrobacteraceae bacterium]
MASQGTHRDERFARQPPASPSDLPKRSWRGVLKRTIDEFRDDNLTDWAAALTYYGIQSLFPMLLVLVSILGLVGAGTTQALIDNIGAAAPGTAKDIIISAIRNLQHNSSSAGILFVVGLVGALWSASGYIGAFSRASNAIYEVGEGRPFWKLRPQQLGITLLMVVLLAASALAVVITGGLAEQVGNLLGIGSTAVQIWDIAKWPVLVLLVSLMFALLYWAAPNVKQPGFRWISPGSLLAVVIWLIASGAFALYVANFSNYNKTYGSLGGVIAFLVWLWISNVAVLLGAEFDAELQRERELQSGRPAGDSILPPRDTTKLKD